MEGLKGTRIEELKGETGTASILHLFNPLNLVKGEMIRLHDEVGEQFLAGFVHFGGGFVLGVGLNVHAYMLSDTHVGNAVNVKVAHTVLNGFALWVE
jgi:hypothetical protein